MPPQPKAVICPQCSGTGQIWVLDARSVRVATPCGHTVCQAQTEDRIAERVQRAVETWAAGRDAKAVAATLMADQAYMRRVIAEVMRHLPPDIAARAKR